MAVGYRLGFYLGTIIGGALFGLIPFFVAKKRGNPKLGLIALIVTAVSGIFSNKAPIIAAIVFVIIAMMQKKD